MPENKLYYGDNLDIMRRYIRDESVDLVYLDPPFNIYRRVYSLSSIVYSRENAKK